MTSATWPPGVRRLASSYMKNPIQVYVGSLDLAATHTVTQIVEIVQEDEKFERICEFVRGMEPNDKAIIFCGKKQRADDLSSDFSLMGVAVQSIHGDRDQSDREQALRDIKDGRVRILVATDVASRGIDIEDITHVVSLDHVYFNDFTFFSLLKFISRSTMTSHATLKSTCIVSVVPEEPVVLVSR